MLSTHKSSNRERSKRASTSAYPQTAWTVCFFCMKYHSLFLELLILRGRIANRMKPKNKTRHGTWLSVLFLNASKRLPFAFLVWSGENSCRSRLKRIKQRSQAHSSACILNLNAYGIPAFRGTPSLVVQSLVSVGNSNTASPPRELGGCHWRWRIMAERAQRAEGDCDVQQNQTLKI